VTHTCANQNMARSARECASSGKTLWRIDRPLIAP
jgi:hypothetical protein